MTPPSPFGLRRGDGFVVLVALLIAASPAAAQDLQFDTVRLDADKADSVDTVDLNNDGRPDLVVTAGRTAKIWLFNKGFAKAPDRTLVLGRDAFLWTAAKFADTEGLQLAVFTSRGIQRYVRTGPAAWGAAEDLIVAPNVFRGAAQEDAAPLRYDFLRDLDGDGLPEALYFTDDALWIFKQAKDAAGRARFKLRQKLPLALDSEFKIGWGAHHRVTATSVVPLLVVGDVNEDKRLDMMYMRRDSVGQFIQREDGGFDTPKEGALSDEDRRRGSRYLKFEAPPRIADFNGDGALDVALPDNYKAHVEIFFSRRGRPDFKMADSVLNVEKAWSTGIFVEDLDGDGKPEIIQGVIHKFGVIGGIDAFVTGKIRLELHVHRHEKAGFTNVPVQQIPLDVPYTFTATVESAVADLKFWPDLRADLNGDGRKDLIVSSEEKELAVYFGQKDGLIASTAEGRIVLNPPDKGVTIKTQVADFNGDKRSDLVIRYDTAGRANAVIEVKITKPK